MAAALLKKQGYNVTGVFMRPWQPPVDNRHSMSVIHRCLWQKDREDAMKVAAKLGIPLLTWDFSKGYKREVADYMIREYRAGRTPNPDVMCNKYIKFGLFLEKALKEGADYIATGHYIKIKNVKIKRQNDNSKFKIIYKLFQARDKNKDQSYFLWTLTQKQLKYCLFPLGDYIKPKIRRMAKKFGLSTANKKDSQGVCFVGSLDMKEFLKNYIKPKRGRILDIDKKLVGYHDGVFYYTIGQRHGLDIKNGKGPYYVVDKDIKKNIIYVGGESDLRENKVKVRDISWINDELKFPIQINAKIRYRSKSAIVVLSKNGNLTFKKSSRAITSGQSVVFYRSDELVGGGILL